MLSYLILTTNALILLAVVFGAIAGYSAICADIGRKKIIWVSALIGLVWAIIIAYFRNATSKMDSAIMNGWLYGITICAFILFLVFSIKPIAKKENRFVKTTPWILLGIQLAALIAYALPDVLAYPHDVLLQEKTMISTDFLLSMIGLALGAVLVTVAFFAVGRSTSRLSKGGAWVLVTLLLLINVLLRASGLIAVFFQKKVIKSNHLLFSYTVFVKNHTSWFIFAALIIAAIAAVALWIRSFRQKDPYTNPAEHRRVRAKWRSIRRWASSVLVTSVLAVFILTVVKAIDSHEVVLSPIEPATAVDNDNVYVDFSLVDDGMLHRFAYTSEKGIDIRFIVIKKPNSSSYGIGLDACDVCGETGYYQRDNQVVCNLCDVVMNISTIGFKGGCNPIVIPYEISNGQIVVPISGLLEYESEFK